MERGRQERRKAERKDKANTLSAEIRMNVKRRVVQPPAPQKMPTPTPPQTPLGKHFPRHKGVPRPDHPPVSNVQDLTDRTAESELAIARPQPLIPITRTDDKPAVMSPIMKKLDCKLESVRTQIDQMQ